jgi:hypothetical protein
MEEEEKYCQATLKIFFVKPSKEGGLDISSKIPVQIEREMNLSTASRMVKKFLTERFNKKISIQFGPPGPTGANNKTLFVSREKGCYY